MSSRLLSVLLVSFVLIGQSLGDPETVDGLYLTKKSGDNVAQPKPAPQAAPKPHKQPDSRFPQARFGNREKQHRAFGRYLIEKPNKWQHQQVKTFPTFQHVVSPSPMSIPTLPPPSSPRPLKQTILPILLRSSPQPKAPLIKPQLNQVDGSTTENNLNKANHINDEQSLNTLKQTAEEAKTNQKRTKETVEIKRAPEPKSDFLRADSSDLFFTGEDGHKAVIGLILGIVFVAAFIAMAVGLAAQGVLTRVRQKRGLPDLFSSARTPNEEDRTPPELRGNGHPAFVQPHGGRKTSNGRQPFFGGKLILQDHNSSTTSSMTSTLFATHAASIMPSPAEQVTDDLISPKYDDETDDDDDTESDDTVYECPGLAGPGEMVVSNPFFMQGRDMAHLQQNGGQHEPKPISQSSIFHHGIKGVN